MSIPDRYKEQGDSSLTLFREGLRRSGVESTGDSEADCVAVS